MTNPNCHGEIGLLPHNESKTNYVWSAGDPLGHLLVLPRTVIKVNGILQQPNPGTDPLGMKVWVTPPNPSLSGRLRHTDRVPSSCLQA